MSEAAVTHTETPTPEPTPEPTPSPEPAATWRDSLGAEIKDHPALARLPDVPALAKSFLETKELVGRKGVILPKEDDPEDVARFAREIGVPETVDGYDLSGFEPPEGLPWDEGFQSQMIERLHKRNVPNGLLQSLLEDYAEVRYETLQQMAATAQEGFESGRKAIEAKYGAELPAAEQLAKQAFKAFAGDHFEELSQTQLADGRRLGDLPGWFETFHAIGKALPEHTLEGGKSGFGGAKSPEQAKAEIAELKRLDSPYWNADHPEHKLVVAKVNDLSEMAYPNDQPEVL